MAKENEFLLKVFYVVEVTQHFTAHRPNMSRGGHAEYTAVGRGGIGKAEMHVLS